jgi:CRISPR-associated endonuclease/helicase Cas3
MSITTTNDRATAGSAAGLLLRGLDGSNPLGFLAALGLLRILADEKPQMSWARHGGTWVPRIDTQTDSSRNEDTLLAAIGRRLVSSVDEHPAKLLEEFGALSNNQQGRRQLLESIASAGDRSRMDWAAAMVSDFATPDSINQIQTARRDYFYGNIKSVISRTKSEHLRRAMFRAWDYADALDNQSLHLDPSEDRRHAHQWNKPAGDPDRKVRGGMLGANRLALDSIHMFTSFPYANTLRTVGFTGTRSTDTRWTWPIWSPGLSLAVVRSLLALNELQSERIDANAKILLRAMGVVAVFRTRRILVGKTPNFTPALQIA